ncbi:DUF5134 domain-containing protein [Streptomyces sp. NPDC127044]
MPWSWGRALPELPQSVFFAAAAMWFPLTAVNRGQERRLSATARRLPYAVGMAAMTWMSYRAAGHSHQTMAEGVPTAHQAMHLSHSMGESKGRQRRHRSARAVPPHMFSSLADPWHACTARSHRNGRRLDQPQECLQPLLGRRDCHGHGGHASDAPLTPRTLEGRRGHLRSAIERIHVQEPDGKVGFSVTVGNVTRTATPGTPLSRTNRSSAAVTNGVACRSTGGLESKSLQDAKVRRIWSLTRLVGWAQPETGPSGSVCHGETATGTDAGFPPSSRALRGPSPCWTSTCARLPNWPAIDPAVTDPLLQKADAPHPYAKTAWQRTPTTSR